MSQPSQQELQAYQQMKTQGYKVDITPEQFYQLKAQGQLQYFRTYEDYLAWVKSSPALQPGAWQPPPKLPEKPTVEDVERALSEAKSTEHIQSVVEQAKKAGIPIEMSPAFYSKEGVGKLVVAFGDVQSGKVVETGIVFKGAGDQNILASQTAEIDISKEIERAQKEGFQNIQLAIEKTFMACKPEDALKISLTGVKSPPPPPPSEPPKDAFTVAKQLLETPAQPGKPVDAAALEFQQWFWKHAPQLAQRYGVKKEGSLGTPEAEEILRKMAEAGELKLEDGMLKVEFKQEKEEFKPPSPVEGVLTALWRGFSGFAGPLAQLGIQLSGARGLGRTAMEEITAKTGIGFGRQAVIIGMHGAPERMEEWKRLTREHAGQILAEAAATGAGIFAGTLESAAEWRYVLGPAIGKVAAKGAELHEKALEEYAKAVNAGDLAGMVKWRTVETFTAPLRGLNWALEKAGLAVQEKRVYAPEKVDLVTVQYKDVAGAAWKFEKAVRDITEKWVMGSPAPRITSLETPYYKVPVGFKEAGATLKVGELPFSLHPSLVKMGGKGVEALAALTREGGGFLLKGFPEQAPLPLASKKTLSVIFPWERVAEEAGKAASSVFSTGGGAAAGGGGAGLLSTLKLSLGGGGIPGVALKTAEVVKPVPLAVPAVPQVSTKQVEKLENKAIALPLELQEKAEAAPSIISVSLPSVSAEKVSLPSPPLPVTIAEQVARQREREVAAAIPVAETVQKQVPALAAALVSVTPQVLKPPAPPLAPPPPAPPGGGKEPPLKIPLLSPPPPSVIYRAQEWRFAKYWRVDWFAEGLKLDFRLGQISQLLAAQAKTARAAAGRAEKAPKPEEAEKAGRREGTKRRKTRQVDWFKGGLLGEKRKTRTKRRKKRGKVRAK